MRNNVLFGVLVTAAFCATATPAVATTIDNMVPIPGRICANGRYADHPCLTDNSTFTVGRASNINATAWTHIQHQLNGQYQPTDLTVVYVAKPVTTGTAETDEIYAIRNDVPGGNAGYTWCDDAVNQLRCDQAYSVFSSNALITDGLACHETGHSVGLVHGDWATPKVDQQNTALGCLVKFPSAVAGLGANNITEINRTY